MKTKRIILLCLSMLILLSFSAVGYAAEASNLISVESVRASPGESVTVPIRISGNKGICGATMSVQYDPNLVLTKITKGEAFSTLSFTAPGILTLNPFNLVWDGMEEDSSNGNIVYLTFTAPQSNGTYPITISYDEGDIVDGTLNPAKMNIQNGEIKVGKIAEVEIDGQVYKLCNEFNNESGKIFAAFYEESGKFLSLKINDYSNHVIQLDRDKQASYAKIMWLNDINLCMPLCEAKQITFN